jgi:hypothetical protein
VFSLGQSDTQSGQNISFVKEIEIETECDVLLSIVSKKRRKLFNDTSPWENYTEIIFIV